jgi:serine protease inhibitor
VDSNGTRAAAATIMEASDGAAMMAEEVILDRSFIYMIVDDYPNDSLPLFIGTVETICTE